MVPSVPDDAARKFTSNFTRFVVDAVLNQTEVVTLSDHPFGTRCRINFTIIMAVSQYEITQRWRSVRIIQVSALHKSSREQK